MSHRPLEAGRKDISSHAALLYSNLLKQLPCSLSRAWEWHGDISPVWPGSQPAPLAGCPADSVGSQGAGGMKAWRGDVSSLQSSSCPWFFKHCLCWLRAVPGWQVHSYQSALCFHLPHGKGCGCFPWVADASSPLSVCLPGWVRADSSLWEHF